MVQFSIEFQLYCHRKSHLMKTNHCLFLFCRWTRGASLSCLSRNYWQHSSHLKEVNFLSLCRSLDKLPPNILREDSNCKEAEEVSKWFKGAFEATEKQYLRELMFVVYDKTVDDEKSGQIGEVYTFKVNLGNSIDLLRAVILPGHWHWLDFRENSHSQSEAESQESWTNIQVQTYRVKGGHLQ